MLEKLQRMQLLNQLGLPDAGQRLILDAAKHAPVRQVKSRGGNVLTYFQSKKMQCSIGTESRHLEFPAAVSHEYDANVLEYYAQPYQLKFEAIDHEGEVHVIDHIPDFLIITEKEAWFEEWKPWAKLENRAKRYPWRYVLDPDQRWSAPLIEAWLAERGIGYRIRTDRDIPQRRIENILLLEDYLDPDAPPCPINIALDVQAALAEEPAMTLADLYAKIPCQAEDALKLIAEGTLIADIDYAPLSEPTRCRVFRDEAIRRFEQARLTPKLTHLASTISVTPNARIMYDERPYTVAFVGASRATLRDSTGAALEIDIQTLEELAHTGSIAMIDEVVTTRPVQDLASLTEREINTALSRKNLLQAQALPERTQRRHLAIIATAKLTGTDELIALVPRLRDRGNRTQRLTPEQEAAIEQVIHEEFLTSRAPNAKHCHRKLQLLCSERQIKVPSYPTFMARINALPQKPTDRVRFGKRLAYQNSEFVHVLYADTPVHGSRAFQYIHMDHTLLDIELISTRTGKSLGRPWLSLAIDAHTRRNVGLYLSFDPPSYRSNMMLLRDIVRRFRCLPQFIVVDNGADFRSQNFDSFCALMGIHVRFRPAGQPRHGAVMERIFGRAHCEYVHNLAGNTKALKNVRQTTGKFLPSKLAEWTLEAMYHGLNYWAFTYYDKITHSVLGMSPCEAHERSVMNSGERSHRIVTLTQDFLIMTCPTAGRKGERTVDRQRGIKVHANYFYWCSEFSDPKLHGKKVPVRYDPWDMSTVYVQIRGRWLPARCKALAKLGAMTEKERELFSDELRSHYRLASSQEPSVQQLTEFMRVFTPTGATQLYLERQQENRELYGDIGIGPIMRAEPVGLLSHHTTQPDQLHLASTDLMSAAEDSLPVPLAATSAINPKTHKFDTF